MQLPHIKWCGQEKKASILLCIAFTPSQIPLNKNTHTHIHKLVKVTPIACTKNPYICKKGESNKGGKSGIMEANEGSIYVLVTICHIRKTLRK